MAKKTLPLSKVYQLIESGPVVMVTTMGEDRADVMSMSWHMMMDFEPPIIGCIISDRNYTFSLLKKSKECVINIPTVEMADKMVAVGNCSGSKVDKFKKFKLKMEAASMVEAPLLGECYASLECKLIDMKLATKYNLFILEVVKAWVRPVKGRPKMLHHCGQRDFIVDGELIKLSTKVK